ncbi:MAG TPA: hypothetical protein VMA95_03800 [Streptosporangiaceae bacterium]|nr:hypothetical protein [Streptosporangiaceae bacterium]
MIRKTLAVAAMAVVGIAVAIGWPDIQRFLKIKQISSGHLHPEMVPAEGRTTYPQRHAAGAPDGTGDFDSAHRGGPAVRI